MSGTSNLQVGSIAKESRDLFLALVSWHCKVLDIGSVSSCPALTDTASAKKVGTERWERQRFRGKR